MTTQNSHLSEIASIISSCRRLEELGNNKTGPRKIIRDAIFFIWETGVNKPTKFSKKRARYTVENNHRKTLQFRGNK